MVVKELLLEGISQLANVVTIGAFGLELFPSEDLSALEDEVKKSYITLDEINRKFEIYDSIFERENLFNETVQIAKDTKTNPLDLIGDLENFLETGYFSKPEEAIAFDGLLRDFMYYNNYSVDQIDEIVSDVANLLNGGDFTLGKLENVLSIESTDQQHDNLIKILGIDESEVNDQELIKGENFINSLVINSDKYLNDIEKLLLRDDVEKEINNATNVAESRDISITTNQPMVKGTEEYKEWQGFDQENIDILNKYSKVTFGLNENGVPMVTDFVYVGGEYIKDDFVFGTEIFENDINQAYINMAKGYQPTEDDLFDFQVQGVDLDAKEFEKPNNYLGSFSEGDSGVPLSREIELLEEINTNVKDIGVGLGYVEEEFPLNIPSEVIEEIMKNSPSIETVLNRGEEYNTTTLGLDNSTATLDGEETPNVISLLEESKIQTENETIHNQRTYELLQKIFAAVQLASLVKPVTVNVTANVTKEADYDVLIHKIVVGLEEAMSKSVEGVHI